MQHFYTIFKTYLRLQFSQVILLIIALLMLVSASVAVYTSHNPDRVLVFKQYIQAKYKIDDTMFQHCVQNGDCYEFATSSITKEQLKVPNAYISFESQVPELRWLRTEVLGNYNAQQLHDELTKKNFEFGENSNPTDISANKTFTNNYSVTRDGKSGVISFIYYDDKVQYISVSQRYPSIGFTDLHNKFEEFMQDPESKFGQPDIYIDGTDSPNPTKIYLRHGLAFVGRKELFIFTPTTEYNPEVMDPWLQYSN
jgi:hypothetical protein